MLRKLFALSLVAVFVLAVGAAAAADKNAALSKSSPTQADVLALAGKYTGWCEPRLEEQDKKAVAEVKKTVADNEFSDVFLKKALDDLISQLTLKLTAAKSLNGLTVSSAYLVSKFPKNRRALNLFGSVLHIYDKDQDAATVFQYTLTLDPKNNLTRLNMANVYLDTNQDEKAKALLDKLEFEDSGNRAVYRALATYYYRKKNAARFREYLFKAAQFKGFKQRKADKKKQQVETNEVKGEESTDAMETKLDELKDVAPLTTADVLEDEYPDAARQIRDKYGKLDDGHKWILPKLPMVNVNGPPDFARNQPVIDEWAKTAIEKFKVFPISAAERAGVDPNASEKVKEAQAQAAGKKQMQEALQQAQDALRFMENVPGISKAEIAEAKAQLEKVKKEQGVAVEDKPVDLAAPPPGVDSGSLFAGENFYNYTLISSSYSKYFIKYYREYNSKVMDIVRVFGGKVQQENDRWEAEWEKLQIEHKDGRHHDAGEYCIECRRAEIEHKKRLNALSDDYYRQWSNLYFPQYAQKMKPTLDAYFNTCMLYIRNMNDPKIMEREYNKVTLTYMTYASQAIGGIGGGGFPYYPETDEEEQELDAAIARSKEEAEAKQEQFKREFQSPEFGFTDWINDHFVLQVSGEFLSLKVTAKSIEFEAYVPGVSAGAKYDFSEEKFETYTGFGGKLDVGVNICGVGAKLEAGGEVYRRTATWDLKNGTYTETDSGKIEATGSFGPLSAGGEFQLDSQLTAKVTTKVSVMGTATVQDEATLN